MTAPCRYLSGTPCDRAACARAGECAGPVDLDAPKRSKGTPGRKPAPKGSCSCGKANVKLYASKWHEGRLCLRCSSNAKQNGRRGIERNGISIDVP